MVMPGMIEGGWQPPSSFRWRAFQMPVVTLPVPIPHRLVFKDLTNLLFQSAVGLTLLRGLPG
jgi:hypothetical protein